MKIWLFYTDGRQIADLHVVSLDGWCKEKKPRKITRIWIGENLSGYLTNIQIYSRLLSNEEMRDITTCKLFLPGDYLSWQTTKWMSNKELSKKLIEDLSDKEYDDLINGFERLLELPFSYKSKDFIFK